MQLLGKDMKARTLLKRAYTLRHELVPNENEAKPDTALVLQDFDCLVSVMHSGTRALPAPKTPEEEALLNNLVGPSP